MRAHGLNSLPDSNSLAGLVPAEAPDSQLVAVVGSAAGAADEVAVFATGCWFGADSDVSAPRSRENSSDGCDLVSWFLRAAAWSVGRSPAGGREGPCKERCGMMGLAAALTALAVSRFA